MGRRARGQDPKTPEEWQEAAALAHCMLLIDAARQYGLVTGGPVVDVKVLSRAKWQSLLPTDNAAERSIEVSGQAQERASMTVVTNRSAKRLQCLADDDRHHRERCHRVGPPPAEHRIERQTSQ